MATIDIIGAGETYTTLQAWYDARKGDGDITDDPNAPYIAEMLGGNARYLSMDGCITDANHYFHIRPYAGRFNGDFNGTGFPVVGFGAGRSGALLGLEINCNYTKVENIMVGGGGAGTRSVVNTGIYLLNTTGCVIDGVGVNYFVVTAGELEMQSAYGILNMGGNSNIIKNCAIGDIRSSSDDVNTAAAGICVLPSGPTLSEIHVEYVPPPIFILNNSINGTTATSGSGTATAYGIQATGVGVYIVNNIVGTLTGATGTTSISLSDTYNYLVDYNAVASATAAGTGTNNRINIVPASIFLNTSNLHLQTGCFLGSAGANIKAVFGDTLTDIDGKTRESNIWSIGCDGLGLTLPSAKPAGTGFLCKQADGTYTRVTSKIFYPNCPKINANNLCNALAGGAVAAVTVCEEGL